MAFVHRSLSGFPVGSSLLRAARRRLLTPGTCVVLARSVFPGGRYITGVDYSAIVVPLETSFIFIHLR